MPERRILVPSLHGGISQQPPHQRYANQVEDAENILFKVDEGAATRRGTRWLFEVTDLPPTGDFRIHSIVRDENERYICLYGDGVLRVFAIDPDTHEVGECTVTVERECWPYLNANSPASGDLRLVTIADATLIVNRTVPVATDNSEDYKPDIVSWNYDSLISIVPQSPDDDLVVQAIADTDVEPRGFWQFRDYDGETWGCANSATLPAAWYTPNQNWADTDKNPAGFNIAFGRHVLSSSSGSWNNGTLTLTITGAFAGYEPESDDMIKVTGGTGVTAGWYAIASKTSDDAIVLGSSISGGSPSNVAVDGIGVHYTNVQWNAADGQAANNYELARKIEVAMQSAGAQHATCSYFFDNGAAYFRIGAPYRGAGSRVYAPTAPTDSGIYDMTAAGRPFNSVSPYNGTGGPSADRKVAPADRWFRIAAPNSPEAVLDPDTMPVRMVRSTPPGTSLGPYSQAVLDDDPWVAYAFTEAAGTTVDNFAGLAARDGTIDDIGTGSHALAQTGTIQETGNKALQLTSTDSVTNMSFVDVDDASSFIPDSGFTVEIVFKITTMASVTRRLWLCTDDLADTRLDIMVTSTGALQFLVGTDTGNYVQYNKNALLSSGNWYHLVCVYDPTGATNSAKYKVWLNNVQQTASSFSISGTLGTFPTGTFQMRVAGHGFGTPPDGIPGITGLFDAVAVYTRALSATEIDAHYDAIASAGGGSATLGEFTVEQIEWNQRTSGTQTTNPVPSLWSNEVAISDIALHRNRLVLAGDVYLVMSRAGDLFNFWLDDPANIVDDDPIDLTLGAEEVALIQSVVPYRKTLFVFTKAGRQFELTSPDVLNQASSNLTPATSLPTLDVKPVSHGGTMRFMGPNGDYASVHEYIFDDLSASTVATDLSAHVSRLVPVDIGSIRSHPNLGLLFIRPADTENDTVYVHRSHFVGQERVQSAWSRWTFTGCRVVDVAVIADDLWLLLEEQDVYSLERLPLTDLDAPAGFPYDPIVDRAVEVTGVHSAGNTTWTLPFTDTERDAIVLGDSFGANAGRLIVPTSTTGTTVVAAGNWSAGPAIVGRLMSASLDLTRPFVRDREGTARVGDRLTHKKVNVAHVRTGAYKVSGTMPSRADREKTFSVADYGIQTVGNCNAWINGDAEQLTLSIESVDARPFVIVSLEHFMDHEPRP